MVKRCLALFFVLLSLLPTPVRAADEPPAEKQCATAEALAELLARDEGGTITVTADITLADSASLKIDLQNPVTVDLGEHSLILPENAALSLSGPVSITGSGAPRPLMQIAGTLTTDGVTVYSIGEDTVAVALSGPALSVRNMEIRAEGRGACALSLSGSDQADLTLCRVSASGEGAAALRADVPVRLIFSEIRSDGLIADAPALTLDCSTADPLPPDAAVIERRAVPGDRLTENGLYLNVGASQEELNALLANALNSSARYALCDVEDRLSSLLFSVPAQWEGAPDELSRPGVYRLTGKPLARTVGGVELPERTVPLYLVDPQKPYIRDIEDAGEGVYIRFYREITGADQLTLYYSADEGRSWENAAGLPGAAITPTGATLEALPLQNHDYLFCLNVSGGPMAGQSNRIRYLHYDDYRWNGGGDWDGGDRTEQGDLPPADIIPPPVETPSSGGSGHSQHSGPKPDSAPPSPETEIAENMPPVTGAAAPASPLPDTAQEPAPAPAAGAAPFVKAPAPVIFPPKAVLAAPAPLPEPDLREAPALPLPEPQPGQDDPVQPPAPDLPEQPPQDEAASAPPAPAQPARAPVLAAHALGLCALLAAAVCARLVRRKGGRRA